MNLFDLPNEHFKARQKVLLAELSNSMSISSKYLHDEFIQSEKLILARDFCNYELMDAPQARSDHLSKVDIFPWIEAARELDRSLSLMLMCQYKSVYDCLRRALELIITGSYFVLDNVEKEKGNEWLNSKRGTPNFKRAVKGVLVKEEFLLCNQECQWEDNVLQLYWDLCDIIHVKGTDNGINKISPSRASINGIGHYGFDKIACDQAVHFFIKTVEEISVIVVLSNPILLNGFDLDRKFGMNAPFSGFLYEGQSDNVRELHPQKYKMFMDNLRKESQEIKDIVQWFESLPDLTEDDLKSQMESMPF
ncbi:hypothetical protein C9J22_20345 [Photobacterium phosphoreum]|uniref:hypothetical protein n=1 Tax=Photobacterium phosphoreum TaxID=659 RepID=UPI000D158A95|nr:hypothetical protein [Photobacterium phosphoreum]PSU67034.1 hypothetical protein C9J22_20345 [Photobacterium phosphoreum]